MEDMRSRVRDDFHVMITTYGMVKRHLEYFSTMWSETEELNSRTNGRWDYVIMDEGHKIKNCKSKMAQFSHKLYAHHRVLLSGTPLQNNLVEMWSIMDWLCEHKLLGSKEAFTKCFKVPIEDGQERTASEETRIYGEEMARKLSAMIYSVCLRREKTVVLNDERVPKLSKKLEIVLWWYVVQNIVLSLQ